MKYQVNVNGKVSAIAQGDNVEVVTYSDGTVFVNREQVYPQPDRFPIIFFLGEKRLVIANDAQLMKVQRMLRDLALRADQTTGFIFDNEGCTDRWFEAGDRANYLWQKLIELRRL